MASWLQRLFYHARTLCHAQIPLGVRVEIGTGFIHIPDRNKTLRLIAKVLTTISLVSDIFRFSVEMCLVGYGIVANTPLLVRDVRLASDIKFSFFIVTIQPYHHVVKYNAIKCLQITCWKLTCMQWFCTTKLQSKTNHKHKTCGR